MHWMRVFSLYVEKSLTLCSGCFFRIVSALGLVSLLIESSIFFVVVMFFCPRIKKVCANKLFAQTEFVVLYSVLDDVS
jgi:hypothetical protein